MSESRQKLEEVIRDYIAHFSASTGLEFEDFTRDDVLGIATFGDYFIQVSDIVFHVDNGIEADVFFEWYDKSLQKALENDVYINYRSWVKGIRYEDTNKQE